MELDPTLTGVIIGGAVGVLGPLLTSLTQILSHWLTGKREDKKWAREQTAAEEKRIGEEKQEKSKETHEIFQNSLRCLGSLTSIRGAEIELAPAEKFQRLEEAHKWLNLLSAAKWELYAAQLRSPRRSPSCVNRITSEPGNPTQMRKRHIHCSQVCG